MSHTVYCFIRPRPQVLYFSSHKRRLPTMSKFQHPNLGCLILPPMIVSDRAQQAYRCTNVPIQEIRCKWIRILNGSKWAIYYEILMCSFWDMSTLILSQVFLKTTFRMGLGDFLLGYVIIGIFWWYIALFGTGKINYMIEITMEKVKFYTEFEIMEKRHLYPTMGKIHQTMCSERYFSHFTP